MKKLLPLLIGLSLGGFSAMSQAENLLQVYKQARESNPDLRKSAADRDAAFEKINEARSPLLPQLGLTAGYNYTSGYRDSRDTHSDSTSGSLALTQTIFDMSKWRQLTLQEKTAGISDVTFQTAEQQLILNTATAYFNVLKAIDTLSYTQAQKDAVYRTLDQTTQRFNVGLVAITDVQNARSNYDTVLAAEVSARNDLDNALETLRQVTGTFYPELASLNTDRFSTQRPEAVNNLLKEAEARNLSLLSARLSQDLAREQIRAAQTGYMPTVDFSASTAISNNNYGGSRNTTRDADLGENKVGLSFNLPLYSGGATNSQVKQAQYGFVGASEQLESSHRSVVQTVRSSFNNVNASISSINAYKQAVISAQSSLDAMEAGYQVGTRTIVDVLDATTTLYNAKRQLSDARYTYLINQLNIKSALGTLNQNDLLLLNGALGKPVSTAPDAVAPQNRAQDAYADGYQDNAPMQQTAAPAPAATRASAPAVTTSQPARHSGNPFRN
ncbi:Outer membrane protein tolC precursor [Serratia marcescens]|uniref:multidrug efflux transporter outer membrane subunit HasF n=1 Tax=Serratia marcescens TaxID=615 RepID=UPI001A361C9C|nr:multidrug efflux transporter outer membrane subunit HasF [Serratia marcescens]CAI1013246.1 Outer membrane protein tolC precursor [Serratia marcescens]CAI1017929.1 Outer membrane protein tolC precursor [Serratia marcescens]CAI1862493.1 Outer membrane protein tolC precursor [Serratia marcescens]CAI1894479.1 Outer membrane protein tolC precursor [Serratia marcescens]HAT4997636.1 multidrug efflux transporter outer membrane subunit HasF [Serratia marcescens]